ncbi:hypothetical protein SAMN04488101_101320 [Pedobacter nyackensis]|uniref:Uncharacterized protein n=1 Tax=Pedobacter nyackensis TaxID=475255 RepID=A0A1W2A8W4_9SPHI|nr:hypothetical protein SAMN04488101_101320 [Pedobacter nyackensis]
MKDKVYLIIISLSVIATIIIKALELLKGGYNFDKILVIIWCLIALFYCIRSKKIQVLPKGE